MTSQSGVWKPTAPQAPETTWYKKIAGPVAISNLSLKSNGAPASVSIYDAATLAEVNDSNLKWFLDASTTDVDNNDFTRPITFTKGVLAVLEQGQGSNPILCFAKEQYTQ